MMAVVHLSDSWSPGGVFILCLQASSTKPWWWWIIGHFFPGTVISCFHITQWILTEDLGNVFYYLKWSIIFNTEEMETMARAVTSPKSDSCSQHGRVYWKCVGFRGWYFKGLSHTSSGNLVTVFALLGRKETWYLETSRPFCMKFVLLPRICGRCSFIHQARRHLFAKALPETLSRKSYELLSLKRQKLDSVAGSVSLWTLERISIF